MKPILIARCPVTIYFYDVDPMNVVWHGNYFRFFEKVRSDLLDLLDYNYPQMKASGFVWPIVDFRIKYIRPLHLQQKIIVEAELVEYENRLKIEYRIYDEDNGEVLTKATSVQVAVKDGSHELEFESPAVLINRVKKVMK
ncbi:MAG TPA: acyl-CoA thioesterase [Alphaproteobacteria bacterium]|nr:acyl-CoA thioesterase [Alphaproteobacteria bacterium]